MLAKLAGRVRGIVCRPRATAAAGMAAVAAVLIGAAVATPRAVPRAAPRAASLASGIDADSGSWPRYGRDAGGSRYAPLAQITRANVRRLRVAWTYHTGDLALDVARGRPPALEVTPIGRIVALDPTTGRARWTFDAHVDPAGGYGDFTSRGVALWTDSTAPREASCRRRVVAATIDARLLAVDAENGALCRAFGHGGTIDLRAGIRNPPDYYAEYEETSPPTVVNDIIVVGSAISDNQRVNAPSGVVRGFDARTGALRWSWDPVPQDSTDPAWRTWIGPRAHSTGAANAWAPMAADPVHDLVYVPTGSPSVDYFGGLRLGDNRWGNSIVALRASTGRLVWGFQTVHHDLWDYDNASPPALVTLTRGGDAVRAVLQGSKTGQLFVLDASTGRPIFPVEERPVPRSTVPGEDASPTQPFTTGIAPLSPQTFPADSAWGPTEADRAACRDTISRLRNEGIFTPPSFEGTLDVPSNVGGAHWGGVAVDPVRQLAIVPVNRLLTEASLLREEQNDDRADEAMSRLRYESSRMRGTPYIMRRRILLGPSGMPCSRPPFGMLVAIDLVTGRQRWAVPLGGPSEAMRHAARGALPDSVAATLGSPNLGGAITTAGGIAFIAATIDRRLHAFDIETGRELWSGTLPAGGRATPMTYMVGGRQYVTVAAGGNDIWGPGDAIVTFALDQP